MYILCTFCVHFLYLDYVLRLCTFGHNLCTIFINDFLIHFRNHLSVKGLVRYATALNYLIKLNQELVNISPNRWLQGDNLAKY